jgi:hypothetical protein
MRGVEAMDFPAKDGPLVSVGNGGQLHKGHVVLVGEAQSFKENTEEVRNLGNMRAEPVELGRGRRGRGATAEFPGGKRAGGKILHRRGGREGGKRGGGGNGRVGGNVEGVGVRRDAEGEEFPDSHRAGVGRGGSMGSW